MKNKTQKTHEEQIMKTVAFYSYVPKLHSLYKEIIKYPPEGYEYAVDPSQVSDTFKTFYTHKKVKDTAIILNKFVDMVRIKDHIYRFKKFPPHNLLYSTGYLCFRKEPWVVDMELPSTFTGYSIVRLEKRKELIRKTLLQPYCKHIIPWSNAASNVMRTMFPELDNKITTVPLVVGKKNVVSVDRKDGKTQFLFVGSSNLPNDFEIKGGPELFLAFEQLSKKYDTVELTVRCYVPKYYKEKYFKYQNIKIIDYIIPWKELESLYTHADVFVGVAHHTPGVAHLEAMSYGLPVIATDVWENSTIVSSDVGLLIPQHKSAPYFAKYGMPNWGTPEFMRAIQQPDPARVSALIDAMEYFVTKKTLQKKMSVAARARVEKGPYSIQTRNKILKKIYDDATR